MGENMELKDLILQTLDEVAQDPDKVDKNIESSLLDSSLQQVRSSVDSSEPSKSKPTLPKTSIESSPVKNGKIIPPNAQEFGLGQDGAAYLENLREKLLVLFEGLKMPELQDTQNKLELVVRFLQYQLCVIDEILQKSE
ncbi:hypothetical protein [Helicobacter sp.]|uniref:CiaD-like domain-containing protein n=1 Tax=Helicobacter sp. TaxID=218 RepID=UPI0025BCD6DD|nr:hypothetical protein [Helicobacter sp.]MBR2494791.1 hypothetical protein [Helicobacter sp.]